MGINLSYEAFVFLCSALCGGAISFLYDLFRLLRKKGNIRGLLLHISDGLFWCLAFIIMFSAMFTFNRGRIRFYEFLGLGLGALLYGFCLSGPVLKSMEKILDFFVRLLKVFLKILLTPLRFMYNIIYGCFCAVLRPVFRLLCRKVKHLYMTFLKTGRLISKQ